MEPLLLFHFEVHKAIIAPGEMREKRCSLLLRSISQQVAQYARGVSNLFVERNRLHPVACIFLLVMLMIVTPV